MYRNESNEQIKVLSDIKYIFVHLLYYTKSEPLLPSIRALSHTLTPKGVLLLLFVVKNFVTIHVCSEVNS